MADADDRSMRASDADREATAERLRIAVGEGRLTLAEYDERLQLAYAAVTAGELADLVADLPAPPAPAPDPSSGEVMKPSPRELQKEWREWSQTTVVLVGIWLVISIAAGGPVFFWPVIPVGIWAAVIVARMIFGDESKDA